MTALPIYGGPTKASIVRQAYGLCGQSFVVFDLDPEDMSQGILCLDNAMAMLGPGTGYNAPVDPPSASEEESGLLASDVLGAVVLTAQLLAPSIGKQLNLSAQHMRAASGLQAKASPPPAMELGRNTIIGAGNRYRRSWFGPFFVTDIPTNEISQ